MSLSAQLAPKSTDPFYSGHDVKIRLGRPSNVSPLREDCKIIYIGDDLTPLWELNVIDTNL